MSGDPIGEYLAALRAGLRTPPARTAEILAEAEDHLRESAAAARQAGQLSEAAAQRAAIDAFGPAKQVTRAHRPPLSAFAAAAALQAWPLLGWYLLLSGALGWTLYSFVPTREKLVAWMPPTGEAVRLGLCLLLGVLLVAGFLIVRRRQRRSGVGPARLPSGIFPLGAAIGFFGIAMLLLSVRPSLMMGHVGWFQLAIPGLLGAILLAVGYGLWFLVAVVGGPIRAEGRIRASRPAAPAAVAAASVTAACQVLGGFLLLSGLIGCFLLFPDVAGFYARPGGGLAAASFGGCLLAGVPLVALPLIVRRRRRAPAPLSRGRSLLCAVVLLLALGIAEYAVVEHNLLALAGGSDGLYYFRLAGECAAVLLGSGWALRTVVSLVSWALAGNRARRNRTPNTLAPTPG